MLPTLLFSLSFFPLFNPHFSTATFPWRSLLPSDLGGLSWPEWCRRSVWQSAEKSGVGDGPREPHCGKRAAGPFRQHPDALLCWGSLRPEWLRAPWWQDRHLESRVENRGRESMKQERSMWREEEEEKRHLWGHTQDMTNVCPKCFPFGYLTVTTRSSCGRLSKAREETGGQSGEDWKWIEVQSTHLMEYFL